MKAKHLLFALFALSLGATSCEKDNTDIQQPSEPKTYTVKLRTTGEVDVTYEPLTRFSPDDRDLYGVQVFHKPASESSYKAYAYGLFDNLDDITLELTENYKYCFEIILIDDGKDKIYRDSILVDAQNYLGYGEPFRAYNKYNGSSSESITKITNEFIIASDKYFNSSRGNFGGYYYYEMTDGKQVRTPDNIDVYYGEVNDYIPTDGVTDISIYLKRMNYGLKVKVGDFFDEGKMSVWVADYFQGKNGAHTGKYYYITPENKELEIVFANNSPVDWYDYTELDKATTSRGLDFVWTKNDGTQIKYDQITASFCRLKYSVINLDYYGTDDSNGESSFVFHYDDTKIEETYKNYIHGSDQNDYEW